MERIERVTQFLRQSGTYTGLNSGYAINYVEHENAKYFEPVSKAIKRSGGWTKTNWLNLVTKFRLEFKYEERK